MAFLKSIEQIRKIQWGQRHLFDVRFPAQFACNRDVPAPFKEFFPAIDIQETIAIVQSENIQTNLSTFSFPRSSAEREIQITFLDDVNNSLLKFFDNWINNQIFNGLKYVATLEAASKVIEIVKLTPSKKIIQQQTYLVYPDGAISYNGDSSGDVVTYSVTFKIVGVIKGNR